MSPFVTKLLFVVLSVAVPIAWGIAVNAMFRRLNPPRESRENGSEDEDEPTIEYYI